MALHEVYVALRAIELGKLVFILDASESAASHQATIIALVRDVLADLPAAAVPDLYFLGNPAAYASRHFASRAVQWFQENQERASLVTPVWETLLKQHEQCTLVIIGSGCLFDLEDWEGTPLLRRVLLVSMGDSLQSAPTIAKEIMSPTAHELLDHLHDPVVSIKIFGSGFLPTWCDNAGYRLHIADDGEASLSAERLDDFSVNLRCFIAQDDRLEARFTHARREPIITSLAPVDSIEMGGSVVRLLSADEKSIFDSAIHKQSFFCIHCKHQLSWDTLKCRECPSLLEKLVYPSLQAHGATSFVVFRIVEDGIQFEIHQGDTLHLGSEVMAIKEGQRAVLYQYDVLGKRWRREERDMKQYHPLGEQAYAVLV